MAEWWLRCTSGFFFTYKLQLFFKPLSFVGWFKPGGTSRSRRLYNYTLHPTGRYVLWDVKETRHGIEQCESALIYTHQVFLKPDF